MSNLLITVLILLLADVAAAQLPTVEQLHRFDTSTVVTAPLAITRVPDGGVLAVTSPFYASATIARVRPDGTIAVLHQFLSEDVYRSALGPRDPLVRGGDGHFYGVTGTGGEIGRAHV